jgi:hypothetical protein
MRSGCSFNGYWVFLWAMKIIAQQLKDKKFLSCTTLCMSCACTQALVQHCEYCTIH